MSHRRELVLAANLMAAPHLVPKLMLRPEQLQEPAARAVIDVLRKNGPVFATPGAMLTALQDHKEVVDPDDLVEVFDLIPERDDVHFTELAVLAAELMREAGEAGFFKKAKRLLTDLSTNKWTATELVTKLLDAIDSYRSGLMSRRTTSDAVLDRLKSAEGNTRWPLGVRSLDAGYNGLDKWGQAVEGMLAQGELTIISAGFKVGKTRLILGWIAQQLDLGASIGWFVLEDSEEKFATKLMGAKVGIQHWKVAQWLAGKYVPIGATDEREKLEAAVEWYASLGDRLRIYDVNSFPDIFDWAATREMISVDKALYETTHIFIDYAQAFSGTEETKDLAKIAREMRKACAQNRVAMVVLSQRSNANITGGVNWGFLDTKNSGDFGAHCHIGFVLSRDEGVLDSTEIRCDMVITRDSYMRSVWANYDPETQQCLSYEDAPKSVPNFGPAPSDKPKKGAKK